jgi:hypothetical protein
MILSGLINADLGGSLSIGIYPYARDVLGDWRAFYGRTGQSRASFAMRAVACASRLCTLGRLLEGKE